jgi:two-component system alkaline phosphatase synthesis response regulator PhoP
MTAYASSKRPAKILLVEDEINLSRSLRFNLEQEGYDVVATASGKEALNRQMHDSFDLILLDVMIEEMDGFEVARRIRQSDQKLPILILTARSAQQDRVQGLEIGADDYMVKPFHLRELLLRIQRMLQRTAWYKGSSPRPAGIRVGSYNVDLEELTGEGPRGELQLTMLEAKLLELLTSEPNRVISRAELLKRVWGYQPDVETRTVDNFVVRLRKYFEEEPERPRHFISIRGRGYKFVP